jgi:LPXTG-motif cell wall-anchored protein
MNPGASFSNTFNAAGTFPYVCQFHESLGMTGTVIVQAGGGGGTLPSTGISDSTAPFVWVGLLFLVAGGAVLYLLRRRRA